jgi:hypothetical protein
MKEREEGVGSKNERWRGFPQYQVKTEIELKELFLSLQEQLIAKFRTTRGFVHHRPTKGAAAEQNWLGMLNEYLPLRYRADAAFVVDWRGKLSEQIDIVIYDRQYSPLIFHQDGVLYVPAESVYAVFDVKHELGRHAMEEAGKKAASVRRLERTSVAVTHAGGKFRPRNPFEIIAGALAVEGSWQGKLTGAVDEILGDLEGEQFLNLGCAVADGAFEAERQGRKVTVEKSAPETALVFFFLRLLERLQSLGTVPAMDLRKYGAAII